MSWNDTVIEEFRAGKDRIAGMFDRDRLLLLHTTGARSGQPRTTPLAYVTLDGDMVVTASYAGRDVDPAWYHNLLANPAVRVERWHGDAIEALDLTAAPAEPADRDRLWERIIAVMPGFAAYQSKTDRVIPVIRLRSS